MLQLSLFFPLHVRSFMITNDSELSCLTLNWWELLVYMPFGITADTVHSFAVTFTLTSNLLLTGAQGIIAHSVAGAKPVSRSSAAADVCS
jgi:hypothetical protein